MFIITSLALTLLSGCTVVSYDKNLGNIYKSAEGLTKLDEKSTSRVLSSIKKKYDSIAIEPLKLDMETLADFSI